MLQVGSLVDNKYKILSEVGHGGMSVVYLAINERANKTWAIKEVRKDGVCNFEAVKQGLVVETNMLKKLSHNHLPSIIDVIDTEDSFLIVMDYIEGRSLQSVIKHGGAQPKDQVVEWGKQLCDVLGYLHSRQPSIIYRDMKPANVMLKPDGNITLIDFGTAREFKDRAMVEDTTCLGTRGYAAPEQFGGRGQTDARTDIYCLGATLYHLLTGHSPAEPPYEIKPLGYWDAQFIGSGLEQIINKCCQQDPAARYQSCAELMYDLEHVEDMNYATQVARRKKWYSFLASVGLFLVGVAGVVGFSLAKNSAMAQTYDAYLVQAREQSAKGNFEGVVDNVEQALEVDPSRYEAYELLLDEVEADYRIDINTELTAIDSCLGMIPDGKRQTCEGALLEESPENYAQVYFRIGKLLFFMSDGLDSNLAQSSTYFDKALNGELGTKDRALATALSRIGKNLQSLAAGGGAASEYVDKKYDYETLWADLKMVIEENPIDSFEKKGYGITMYSRVANMILFNCSEFLNVDISAEEIQQLLDQMQVALNETREGLTKSEEKSVTVLIDSAESNVISAKKQAAAGTPASAGGE